MAVSDASLAQRKHPDESDQLQALERPAEEIPADDALGVVAILMAQAAEDEPAVRRFRMKVLGDGLLPAARVREWLAEHGADAHESGLSDTYAVLLEGDRVLTAQKGDRIAQRLWRLAADLAGRYDWTEPAAAGWVLTGTAPALPLARVRRVHRTYEVPGRGTVSYDRIVLDVYPTMQPAGLADLFRQHRQGLGYRRPRQTKRPTAEIVKFLTVRPKDEPWQDRVRAWNKRYPNWAYTSHKNLQRDYRRAVKEGGLRTGRLHVYGILTQPWKGEGNDGATRQ